MKTNVRSITIKGDYGVVVIPMQQQPDGNLKRRYLQHLLEYGIVLPSENVNKLLLETLNELQAAYAEISELDEENRELIEDFDQMVVDSVINEDSMLDDIDELRAYVSELEDDINDLQAEMAEMYAKKC